MKHYEKMGFGMNRTCNPQSNSFVKRYQDVQNKNKCDTEIASSISDYIYIGGFIDVNILADSLKNLILNNYNSDNKSLLLSQAKGVSIYYDIDPTYKAPKDAKRIKIEIACKNDKISKDINIILLSNLKNFSRFDKYLSDDVKDRLYCLMESIIQAEKSLSNSKHI